MGYRYRHAHVSIYRHTEGKLEVLKGEEILKVQQLDKRSRGPLMGDRKDIDRLFDQEIIPKLKENSVVLPTGQHLPLSFF